MDLLLNDQGLTQRVKDCKIRACKFLTMLHDKVLFTEKIRRELRNFDGEIILLQNSGNINNLKAMQSGSRAI